MIFACKEHRFMNHILVPTDFSENARNALQFAYNLARAVDARIYLFHTYHIPYIHAEMPAGMYQTAINEAEQEAKQNMEKLANDVLKQGTDEVVPFTYDCKLGFAVEEILNYAEEQKVDMILMGTQGINGVADVIFGSITSSIVDKAECPVLAVQENSAYREIKNVAFATSYDKSDLKALQDLVDFVTPFNAAIKVVHVNEEGESIEKRQEEEFKEKISGKIEYNKLEFEVCQADDVAQGINRYVDEHDIDIIAVMKKKRGMFHNLFHRSITRKMAFHAKVPLLAYHE